MVAEPGEETVLGPPKLAFASSTRNSAKLASDGKERTGITSIDGDSLGDRFPRDKNERWTRDRDVDRNRDTKGYANGRRGGREDGEGWTSVKGRKSLGQEDFERFSRNGDRNREKHEGDPETDLATRRTTRERPEQRWGRRDDKEESVKTGVQGGWRDRDRDRERERDRDWTRSGNKADEDPEWMDTKIEKQQPKPRTQEDFQRWKESMRAKDAPIEEKHESKEFLTDATTAVGITAAPMLTAPLQTPSTAEPTQGILFGNWGRDKTSDAPPVENTPAKAKTDKKSRFMTMFAKPEESIPPSQSATPSFTAAGPPPEANADKEGFQRILQMLGQVNVGGSAATQPSIPTPTTNGPRHGGGISLDMHQQSPPPEPQIARVPGRTMEQQNILENILASRPPMPESRPSQQSRFSNMSPDNATIDQFRIPRPDSSQPEEHFSRQPPPQRNNPQDANLAAILNSRAREESQRDQATKQRERDFLLTLMQQPSRATPPQMVAPNLPRNPQENMAFFEQSRQQPQQQVKGRNGVPPGFMDDQRMFSDNDMMRREAEARREQELRQQLSIQQQQQLQQQQQQQQEAMRNKNTRIPMGFPGHDDALMGLQRRNTGGDPRLATNMGIPSQPTPDMGYMGGRGQPGMPLTPQERPGIAPPPGFGGPMRQPPGLGGPNGQQMGPGGPNFSAGNTPLGHPPGFPPPGSNMRGMGFPGGPGGPVGNGMQGPPQGYFPPPGYGPPPGMRGEDPRMMFGGQFEGPGPRQQPGRPGPPNMY